MGEVTASLRPRAPVVIPIVIFLFMAWFRLASPTFRGAGVFGATAFSLIETFWTFIFAPPGVKGHTTWAQFFANVLYAPVLLLVYPTLIPGTSLTARMMRVALYPLNVWVLEIVEGYGFMFLFRRNVAWTYEGCPDSLFHGNIRLAYAFPWLGMGLALEFGGFQAIVLDAAQRLGPQITPVSILGAFALAFAGNALGVGWPKLVL